MDVSENVTLAEGVEPPSTQEDGRLRYKLYSDEEIESLPQPSWLIEGVLPENGLVSLIGPTKSFKSFIALDWAYHIAFGMPWQRRKTQEGQVIYLYAEGVSGLKQRVQAWKRSRNLSRIASVRFLTRSVALNHEQDVADLRKAMEKKGPQAALIVVDTLNRNLAGDENSTKDMGAFIAGCDGLRALTGATVVVVHHTGHSALGRGRGSSALPASVDTEIQCTRDGDRVALACSKQKDAREFETIILEAVPVDRSLVLRGADLIRPALKGQRLTCLWVLQRDHEGGATHAEWRDSTGLAPSSFDKARKFLADDGYVHAIGKHWSLTDKGRAALNEPSNDT